MIELNPKADDHMVWRWTSSGTYSSSSAYSVLCLGQLSLLGAKELWKARAPSKCCFFSFGPCYMGEPGRRKGSSGIACTMMTLVPCVARVQRQWITSSSVASSVMSSGSSFFAASDGRISHRTRMMQSSPGGWTRGSLGARPSIPWC
jgi:hypothetical protein